MKLPLCSVITVPGVSKGMLDLQMFIFPLNTLLFDACVFGRTKMDSSPFCSGRGTFVTRRMRIGVFGSGALALSNG